VKHFLQPTPLFGRRPRQLLAATLLMAAIFVSTGSGCASKTKMDPAAFRPSPTASQLLKTESGGFVFTRGERGEFDSCRYVVIVTPTQTATNKLYLRTRFENPANASRPFELDSEAPAQAEKIQLESPPVRGLRPGKNYKVEVVLFDSPERNHAIGLHIQLVQSLVKF